MPQAQATYCFIPRIFSPEGSTQPHFATMVRLSILLRLEIFRGLVL